MVPRRILPGLAAALLAAYVCAAPTIATAQPAAHAPATSGPAISVAPIEGLSQFPESDRSRLRDDLRGGLERAGFGLTSGNAADAIVKTTVTKELGDYRIRADYAAQGQPALSVESTCELCGVDELGESLASVGGHLRRRVTRLDEAATLRVTSSPEGAEVRLNGELLGETPLETEVKAGAYELSVGSEGYKTEERGVDLEPATQASFQMTLRRQGFKKWLPWVLLGAGGAALIPGIALIAIDQNEIQRDCNPDIDGRCQYLYDTMPGGVTLTIAGAGLLISGATLAILWRPDRGRGKFAQRLSPAPGGLTLRF